MNSKFRGIIAVLAGIVVSVAVVLIMEAISVSLFPPPRELQVASPEVMKEYIARLPAGAFALVIAGSSLGTLAGGTVAALMARERPYFFAGIVGAANFVVSVLNMLSFPHPVWFMVTVLVLIPVCALAGAFAASLVQGKSKALVAN